ncbi:MAG: sulfur oxidation c-type cytochrome SoxA [Alphaproteobacteria bacterium]
MTKVSYIKKAALFVGLGVLVAACAPKEEALKSGYFFSIPETQAMQDDDFSNPAFMWVDLGEEEWNKKDGKAGKSCASCHKVSDMKGVSVTYPKVNKATGKLRALQDVINDERVSKMGAKPYKKWDGDQMLGLTAFVKLQSRGMPVDVKIDKEAKPFYDAGKAFYDERRGAMDLACKNCHVDYPGVKIRANLLSNGLGTGFPSYRLKWQKVGSLHRRFRGCNKNIRAQPYKQGSDEYTNLELYLQSRAKGTPSDAPSVRM